MMDGSLRKLANSARVTALRARAARILSRSFLLLPLVLVYAIGALTYVKVSHAGAHEQRLLLWGALLPLALWLGDVVWVALKRQPENLGAVLLDRVHGLDDRLTNALEFSRLPEKQQTPLMRLAVADAVKKIGKLSPRKAAPFTMPRELGIVLLLTGGLVLVALLEVPVLKRLPPPPAAPKPLVMTGDDIELFRDLAKELEEQSQDAEALAAVRRFNQLIEDVAQRRLDRKEVFRRLADLEKDLSRANDDEREATEEGLKGLAQELEKSDLSKPTAKALKEQRLADAEKALRELAEKLKNKKKPPTKAQLQRLRQALERASKASHTKSQGLLKEKQELEERRKRLLDKKKKNGDKLGKRDQKELDKLERRLERLDREKRQADRASQKMSELDRKLAEAARDLMKASGSSAEKLEASAEDMNRMARQKMSDKEKRELLKRLQEMRELMRQQGAGGQKRMQRLVKFGRRARGGKEGSGQGKPGQGQGRPGAVLPVPGGGGQSIPMPGEGQAPGMGQARGSSGDQPGSGGPGGGKQWGTGHDEAIKGDKTGLESARTKDVMAAGADTGEGEASSEVIYGAAQRGFVGRGYQKVYTDYRTVAERVMDQDEIPPGYRFYVRRYFQLIRPRE